MTVTDSLPVLWLSMGGTIQAQGHDPLDADRYFQTGQSLTPEQVLEPVAAHLGRVTTEVVTSRPSHDLTHEEIRALVDRLRGIDPATTAGVVVSLGSNGLEEVAFLLWLFGAPVPVAVTASMRPPTAIGSDATVNLVDAISVVRTEAIRPHNVVVVSDGAVLHPAEVMKSHSTSVDSFRTSAQPIGTVRAGAVHLRHQARPGPLRHAAFPARFAPVELVTSYVGADGQLVRHAVDRGVRGIVSAGMGAGFPTATERTELLAAADAGVVVCQAQRTPFGSVSSATAPFLGARTLSPQKSRLLLAVALGLEPAPEDLQGLLDLAAGV